MLNGERYISAAEAGAFSGFTRDYIAKMCREGKLAATRVGKGWFVSETALKELLTSHEYEKGLRRKRIAEERRREYQQTTEGQTSVTRPAIATDAVTVRPQRADEPLKWRVGVAAATAVSAPFVRAGERLANSTAAKHIAQHTPHVAPAGLLASLSDLGQKVAALFMALVLTFGTYSLFDPQYAVFTKEAAVHIATTVREAPERLSQLTRDTVVPSRQQMVASTEALSNDVASLGAEIREISKRMLEAARALFVSFEEQVREGPQSTHRDDISATETASLLIEIAPYGAMSAGTQWLQREETSSARLVAEELCLGDVCITKEDLEQLLIPEKAER